ncbi:GNAT family N-acetyltransferase [Streptomyces somaliensis DSM 40738]|uniref:GNAT family N-acetyltransferase n=1 Tax=Streptomyces somaliensis (strain ATCC 33201 / DSM 40738 / JCM 12659 / KCTC 9044 / NCTC 11332 / NRRL B-12077 / IP 733) TaxID=1134445 RepID=A0AA44IEU8_STRE0|nr:GNAT family N-acetyltransferase [Streptomyces somaliensis]MCQ0023748.1 GNAT family N-acetyltransferase [Streptomyces somaliensis DSM 40738]NKY15728.1 GNAT family N-acetyltransferase [Streptomyces somaliensis DSM 40738]
MDAITTPPSAPPLAPPAAPPAAGFAIRPVRPDEHAALGEISARAYLDDGLLTHGADDPYLDVLRDVPRRAAEAEVLVAADRDGTLLGGVTFVPSGGTPWADIAGPDEAEFRVLAVAGAARGRGVGEALVRACADRARAREGCVRLVLSVVPEAVAARRLYDRTGFARVPHRDWEPLPGLPLYAYELTL